MEDLAQRQRAIARRVLDAWNTQDVDAVLACYTPDAVYLDPTTHGPVEGREAFGRYLTKLFAQWRMHWELRDLFPFDGGCGSGVLWEATLAPQGVERSVTVQGMDLVLLRGELLERNEVYFDTSPLASLIA